MIASMQTDKPAYWDEFFGSRIDSTPDGVTLEEVEQAAWECDPPFLDPEVAEVVKKLLVRYWKRWHDEKGRSLEGEDLDPDTSWFSSHNIKCYFDMCLETGLTTDFTEDLKVIDYQSLLENVVYDGESHRVYCDGGRVMVTDKPSDHKRYIVLPESTFKIIAEHSNEDTANLLHLLSCHAVTLKDTNR